MKVGVHGAPELILRSAGRAAQEPIVRGVVCARGELLEQLAAWLGPSYNLEARPTGPAALRLTRESAPDLLLCEHAPPALNGLRLVSIAKSDPALFTIPVVLIWRTESPADIEHAVDVGADDVLSPTLEPALLRARVRAATRSRAALRQLVANHTELTRMFQLLEASRARTRAIIESAHDGIVMLHPDGAIESTNPAARLALGLAEEAGGDPRHLQALVAPASRPELERELARAAAGPARPGATSVPCELTGLRSDGAEFPLECRIVPVQTSSGLRLCGFLRDLTESKRLLLELQQAQKLESVGRLAAGIAHEINTPIQFIGDNTSFLREAFQSLATVLEGYRQAAQAGAVQAEVAAELATKAEEQDVEYMVEHVPGSISSTLEGVERVATIVRAMKEFAHVDRSAMAHADLNRALQATLQVARNEYRYVADVRAEWGDIPAVVCRVGEINQVFLNLIVNAAHAIADVVHGTEARGRIGVSTRLEGDHVVVRLSDTGCGIPEAIRERIYDPFFTTKEVGRGSGQGLAIARSVIMKHGGRISFESTVGVGTTFEVRLPLVPPGQGAGG